jgi:hypothetical protein
MVNLEFVLVVLPRSFGILLPYVSRIFFHISYQAGAEAS